jgi:hypothetical protein
MFSTRQIIPINVLSHRISFFGHLFIRTVDYMRTWLLRRTLKVSLFRKVYNNTALRLGATAIFIFYLLNTRLLHKKYILMMIVVNFLILRRAWDEPLNFVSATLFAHNWMAFAYWILTAKDKTNRQVAIVATFIFAIIHALVITGQLDHMFAFQSEGSLLAANIDGTTWILSPWSNNPLVGQRALVLYTFGLSLHYFIWLKAIPENRQNKENPNSFKVGFKKLQNDIGNGTTLLLIGVICMGLGIWIFSFSLGATIYFTIATLHIWLEFIFIIPRLFLRKEF